MSPKYSLNIRPEVWDGWSLNVCRVYAEGVILCEKRVCFCLLSTF